jgi:hypothetical protein
LAESLWLHFTRKPRLERDQICGIVPRLYSASARHTEGRAIAWPSRYDVRGNTYRIVSPQPFNLSTTQTSPAFINNILSGNILINTSQAATDTIDYVTMDM